MPSHIRSVISALNEDINKLKNANEILRRLLNEDINKLKNANEILRRLLEERKSTNAGWRAYELERERHRNILNAAQAVVERWDSPLWKDLPHTGEFIHRLREAIADYE